MLARMIQMDEITVLADSPRFYPRSYNKQDKKISAMMTITLREAAKRNELKY